MQQGVLYFERQTERMDIRFENKEIYGGLHCGTAMEVLINDEWIPSSAAPSWTAWTIPKS